ncbi:uncharacterized protein LOC117544077 [Gymnodraco acuticeps]|uniref:Gypsy retrotransposon integrase-like protein 1 n=1 Tax=Gymnodraco acuticeps TaxID=8218 RepID=A0A6P8TWR8_GYMAC|nr:uncharacterized protein LOC117544077 [Gymnodraco acuticeps]
MGLTVFPVPVHKMYLDCDLVKGEVAIGVRPAFPIKGIHFILGNGLAGGRVWADVPSVLLVTGGLMESGSEKCSTVMPDVTASCVITRARAKRDHDLLPDGKSTDTVEVPSLSDFSVLLTHHEVGEEQRQDSSLKDLFDCVKPVAQGENTSSGYMLHNDLLFRRWVPVAVDGGGTEVFQLVVPTKFCPLVLKVAHDECGHFGVRKTYLNILRHYFWPRLKRDVSQYIRTCHECQLTGKPNQKIKPAPLQPIQVCFSDTGVAKGVAGC